MPDRPLPPADDLELLLGCLPERVAAQLRLHPRRDALLEVVLDLGRLPEARFPGRAEDLGEEPVSREDLAQVVARVGRFGKDNRAGIERTLHRISAIRNRMGDVVGLTCRVGRALRGTVDVVRDKIEGGCSILLLGRPGVGKTTLLREAARVLADELAKRVVVVDTSNEIAGDGDIPHPAIGRARRMQVAVPEAQHAVMIEAVENHMPEVVVIDEIGTEAEAAAARTIAERGVQLVATAHGVTLDNLLANPTLSDLVGGVHVVTLSDEEARRRGTQKTVLERKAPPTFEVLIEIQDRDRLAVHEDVAEVVDLALRGIPPRPQLRVRTASGEVEVTAAPPPAAPRSGVRAAQREPSPVLRVEEVFAFPPAGGEPPPVARSAVGRRRGAVDRARRGNGGPYPLAPPIAPATPWRTPLVMAPPAPASGGGRRILRIHPYAVSRSRLEKLLADYGLPVRVVRDPDEADLLLTVKAQERRQPRRLREAMTRGMRVVVLKANTGRQIEEFLREEFGMSPRGGNGEREGFALREVAEAIDEAMASGAPVELAPQERAIRRLQHLAIERAGLASMSRGAEPERRVVVMPG